MKHKRAKKKVKTFSNRIFKDEKGYYYLVRIGKTLKKIYIKDFKQEIKTQKKVAGRSGGVGRSRGFTEQAQKNLGVESTLADISKLELELYKSYFNKTMQEEKEALEKIQQEEIALSDKAKKKIEKHLERENFEKQEKYEGLLDMEIELEKEYDEQKNLIDKEMSESLPKNVDEIKKRVDIHNQEKEKTVEFENKLKQIADQYSFSGGSEIYEVPVRMKKKQEQEQEEEDDSVFKEQEQQEQEHGDETHRRRIPSDDEFGEFESSNERSEKFLNNIDQMEEEREEILETPRFQRSEKQKQKALIPRAEPYRNEKEEIDKEFGVLEEIFENAYNIGDKKKTNYEDIIKSEEFKKDIYEEIPINDNERPKDFAHAQREVKFLLQILDKDREDNLMDRDEKTNFNRKISKYTRSKSVIGENLVFLQKAEEDLDKMHKNKNYKNYKQQIGDIQYFEDELMKTAEHEKKILLEDLEEKRKNYYLSDIEENKSNDDDEGYGHANLLDDKNGLTMTQLKKIISNFILDDLLIHEITHENQFPKFDKNKRETDELWLILLDEHFTCILWIANRESLYCFDSYGDEDRMRNKIDMNIARKIAYQIDEVLEIPIKENEVVWQTDNEDWNTNDCGYCLTIFLHNILNLDETFGESTEFNYQDEKLIKKLEEDNE